jgi:hypothetical protein
MNPDKIPLKILDVWLKLWADEGFEIYWKLSPRWGWNKGDRER